MTRQQILYRTDTKVHIVLTEAALRYRLCPLEVLEGQLDRLLNAATMRTVRFGVIPFNSQNTTSPLHGFSVYDEREVCVETLTASLTLAEPSEIGAYLQLFGEYAAVAVYGAEARSLITRVMSEIAPSAH